MFTIFGILSQRPRSWVYDRKTPIRFLVLRNFWAHVLKFDICNDCGVVVPKNGSQCLCVRGDLRFHTLFSYVIDCCPALTFVFYLVFDAKSFWVVVSVT